MIRIKTTVKSTPLDGLQAFFRDFDKVAFETFERVADPIGKAAVQELSAPVGRVKYPVQWASERQRKAYFATNGFGKGIPYQRTGATLKAWKYSVKRQGRNFTFIIENDKPWSKFLFGSLAKNPTQAARFQQPMHKATGYPLAGETSRYWVDELVKDYRKEMRRIATTATSSRAFTGR